MVPYLVTAHVLQAGEGSWVVRLLLGTHRDRPSRVHALQGCIMHCTRDSEQWVVGSASGSVQAVCSAVV